MKKISKIFLITIGWILFFLLIYKVGLKNVIGGLANSNKTYLIIGMMIFFVAQILRGLKWSILFNNYISVVGAIKLYFENASYSIFTPLRMADFFVSFLFKKNDIDITIKESSKIIFIDKVIDLITVLFFSLVGIYFFVSNNIFDISINYKYFVIGIILVGILIVFLRKKFVQIKNKIIQSKMYISRYTPKQQINLIVLSFVAFIFEIVSGFCIIFSIVSLDFWIYFLLKPISILIGIISLIPAGIGIESCSIIYLLSLVGEESELLMLGILISRIMTTLVIICVGQIIIFTSKKLK